MTIDGHQSPRCITRSSVCQQTKHMAHAISAGNCTSLVQDVMFDPFSHLMKFVDFVLGGQGSTSNEDLRMPLWHGTLSNSFRSYGTICQCSKHHDVRVFFNTAKVKHRYLRLSFIGIRSQKLTRKSLLLLNSSRHQCKETNPSIFWDDKLCSRKSDITTWWNFGFRIRCSGSPWSIARICRR